MFLQSSVLNPAEEEVEGSERDNERKREQERVGFYVTEVRKKNRNFYEKI